MMVWRKPRTWSRAQWLAVMAGAIAVTMTAVLLSAGRSSESLVSVEAAGEQTQVAMRNVDFYVDTGIVLRVRHLRGTMRSLRAGPIVFDDKRSFSFRVAWAEVALTAHDLTALLNRYVFNFPGANVRHLAVRVDGDQIVQTGRLRKGISVPFEIRAQVSATPAGMIRIHPTRVRVVGIGTTRLMRAVGLELDDLVRLDSARGARADGNDILLLDPALVLPPPLIEGRVTSVRLENGNLVQVLGSRSDADALGPLSVPDPRAPNYMFYRGGTLRFGKLLMLDADLQIVDLDPEDPFRFYLDRYADQLVAGFSRTLRDQGLEVFMKDIDKVGKR
jgi:hypothetical protein